MVLGAKHRDIQVVAYGAAFAAVATIYGWIPSTAAELIFPSSVLLVFLVSLMNPEPIDSAVARLGAVALGVGYCAGLIPFLAQLRELDQGQALALVALFCTWGADTGAYFAGRALGNRKLYPAISPKKTIEGAIGGLFAAVAVAFFIRWLLDAQFSVFDAAVLGLIASVFGVVGDLCESLLKRSTGVKDSSQLIPGHGGVLDRFDGVMFTAPAMYVYVSAINGVG